MCVPSYHNINVIYAQDQLENAKYIVDQYKHGGQTLPSFPIQQVLNKMPDLKLIPASISNGAVMLNSATVTAAAPSSLSSVSSSSVILNPANKDHLTTAQTGVESAQFVMPQIGGALPEKFNTQQKFQIINGKLVPVPEILVLNTFSMKNGQHLIALSNGTFITTHVDETGKQQDTITALPALGTPITSLPTLVTAPIASLPTIMTGSAPIAALAASSAPIATGSTPISLLPTASSAPIGQVVSTSRLVSTIGNRVVTNYDPTYNVQDVNLDDTIESQEDKFLLELTPEQLAGLTTFNQKLKKPKMSTQQLLFALAKRMSDEKNHATSQILTHTQQIERLMNELVKSQSKLATLTCENMRSPDPCVFKIKQQLEETLALAPISPSAIAGTFAAMTTSDLSPPPQPNTPQPKTPQPKTPQPPLSVPSVEPVDMAHMHEPMNTPPAFTNTADHLLVLAM